MELNIFELIIVQPIFNLLLFIHNFVGDFGIAIIILTIIIRCVLWPLVRKQMRQTKLMREVQPEIKKIKAKTKGNRMLESQMTMELYKEKGVKPFSSILVLIIQLPIFIAVFQVIRMFSMHGDLAKFAYPFMENFGNAWNIIQNPEGFSPSLLGLVDLTTSAFANGPYIPLIIIALIAAGLQFYQTRQITPQAKTTEKKKVRDYFKDAAAGKEVDQSEMSAAMTKNMMYFFPILTFFIAISLPGAVVLYFAAQAAVAVGQQAILLKTDKGNPEKIAEAPAKKSKAKKAKEAVVVMKKSDLKKQEEKRPSSSGQTVVRRIKAR